MILLDAHVWVWWVSQPGVLLLDLNPRIVVESTQLPQPFHRYPADQLIVATARVFQAALMTEDSKIAAYPHITLA